MTVSEAQNRAVFLLSPGRAAVPSPSARLDADYLLSSILGKEKSFLFAHPQYELSCSESHFFFKAIEQRSHGYPAAYILQKKEFYGIDFFVTPDVLIPKPDTEMIIDEALSIIQNIQLIEQRCCKPLRIADICTGSGCIIITVLAELAKRNLHSALEVQHNEPHDGCTNEAGAFAIQALAADGCTNEASAFIIEALAADLSGAALSVAKKNADTILNKCIRDTLNFYQGDLMDAVPAHLHGKFHVIMSNPPYVPSDMTNELLSDGRGEPALALDGGYDGLDIIRRLIPQVYSALASGGYFLLETGEYNAAQAAAYSAQAGFTDIVTLLDWGGQPRLMRAKKI